MLQPGHRCSFLSLLPSQSLHSLLISLQKRADLREMSTNRAYQIVIRLSIFPHIKVGQGNPKEGKGSPKQTKVSGIDSSPTVTNQIPQEEQPMQLLHIRRGLRSILHKLPDCSVSVSSYEPSSVDSVGFLVVSLTPLAPFSVSCSRFSELHLMFD